MDGYEGTGRGAAIGHGFHDQRRFKPTEADTAGFLADVDRAEAEFGALLDHVDREVRFLVPFPGKGRDVVGREALRHFLDLQLFFGELELSCIRRHGARCSAAGQAREGGRPEEGGARSDYQGRWNGSGTASEIKIARGLFRPVQR